MKKDNSGYWIKWKVRKPCPFCGGKAVIDEYTEAEPYETSYYYQGEKVTCSVCCVSLREHKGEYATDEVPYYDIQFNREIRAEMRRNLLKRWNKRVN